MKKQALSIVTFALLAFGSLPSQSSIIEDLDALTAVCKSLPSGDKSLEIRGKNGFGYTLEMFQEGQKISMMIGNGRLEPKEWDLVLYEGDISEDDDLIEVGTLTGHQQKSVDEFHAAVILNGIEEQFECHLLLSPNRSNRR